MFKWKEAFGCSIKDIDDQHKTLFEIGSRVYGIASGKGDFDRYDDIISVLDELKYYTIKHFKYEENLMKEYNYHNYEKHKMEHDFFIKKITRIEKKDLETAQRDAIMEIVAFVADWISGHIIKTDMEYKDFFLSKGVC